MPYDKLMRPGETSDEEIQALLAPAGFANWRAAHRYLLLTATDAEQRKLLSELLPHLLHILSSVADPDRVLLDLQRLALSTPDTTAFLRHLRDNPRTREVLAVLFAGSQFLTDILLRNPEYFEQLSDPRWLAQIRAVEQLHSEAQAAMCARDDVLFQLDTLRHFQRRELLRIGACDLLDLFDMSTTTMQLSSLADCMVQVCLGIAGWQTGIGADDFTVIAMGKLGGQELNYSSDIDLLFVAASETAPLVPLAKRLIDNLTRITSEGFLYRVDMRLRPWGQTGALIASIDGYLTYLNKHARIWEKQALLKARVIAGDEGLGSEFLRRIEPILFALRQDDVRAEVHAMKQLTEAHLRGQGRVWGEVKLGEGSIRDIEFVTQYLQLVYGGRRPELRSHKTLEALSCLCSAGLMLADDFRVLADGYVFLRTIEHHLQMMHYRQTNTLPADPQALDQLARRLRFQGANAQGEFLTRYKEHCAAVRAVYLRYLGSNLMTNGSSTTHEPAPPSVRRHVARMDPSYSSVFSADEIQRHVVLAEQLDDESPVQVESVQFDDGRWRVTIIAYDYPGELTLICGLLFAYGFSIIDGNAFTYQPQEPGADDSKEITRRKLVDVFTVEPVREDIEADIWARYSADLSRLVLMTQAGQRREARGELAKRVVAALQERKASTPSMLYPVDVEVDNATSEQYTLLTIDAADTPGFLYELTNALAISRIYIARLTVDSAGQRANDTLLVTDFSGKKITDPGKIHELRAAIVLIKHFTHLLPLSSNPETALLHFREFIGQLFSRPNWPDELTSLEQPEVLDALARVLGVSEFLWDDFLRMQYASLFPVVKNVSGLAEAKSREALQAGWLAIRQDLPEGDRSAWREALNAFKDREMFRVDMRYILGYAEEFGQFSRELTDLVEVIIEAVTDHCIDELHTQYGLPQLDNGRPCPLAVIALGKCGGRELGFASDIELMFIYGGSGKTTGPRQILAAEFHEKLVEMIVDAVRARREGIFQIDLQLRPYGKAGSLAVSIDSFSRYFGPGGPAWDYERQALVRMRPIAGDAELGRHMLALRDEFVYTGEPFNTPAMRAMRERQIRHLVTGGMLNIKYSPGGLVDVEYLVQGLQITHGHRNTALRSPNTRDTLSALDAAGILSDDNHKRLAEAYLFLRLVINALRMVRGNAKDLTVPPEDSEEFAFLARRVGYGSTARLHEDLIHHMSAVQEIGARLLP